MHDGEEQMHFRHECMRCQVICYGSLLTDMRYRHKGQLFIVMGEVIFVHDFCCMITKLIGNVGQIVYIKFNHCIFIQFFL